MRLSEQEQRQIVTILKRHFGASTRILLFGSRVDDRARGGDIDLYIEPELQDSDAIVEAKLEAMVELHQRLGEQKIDLVICRQASPDLPVHRVARETGVVL
ncbi:nucleotidyltransferase domain-containing protein [Halomonas sp. ATCH28]|uniref:Nucleotidyltransferase domain-containing protein n=1 Tax=Halomonas gemina TaxID=2945105 RepID=A0ABT0SX72_9GAMM|nr:nucleotidyltransferase domain-containing protein [Halomonas gemina]MCL7939259.1 nucleotidyltransferase domain-containing protein [Halomonas gemina]